MQLDFNARLNLSAHYKSAFVSKTMNRQRYNEFLRKIAEETHKLSMMYVPKKTGALQQSAELISLDNSYSIIYSAPYAGYVHEIMYYSHQAPTSSKYLIRAFKEVMTRYRISYYNDIDKIPDFFINFYVIPGGGMRCDIRGNYSGDPNNANSWRRWIW